MGDEPTDHHGPPATTLGSRAAAALRDRPAAAAVALVVAVGAVRAADVLLLGLHERVGALALSTTLAAAGAWGFLRVVDGPREEVRSGAGDSTADGLPGAGLAADRAALGRAALVGVAGVAAVQAAAHALELLALAAAGAEPALALFAENPATKSRAPGQVLGYVAFAVGVTAVGEELLFRRALLGALSTRLSFRAANAAQGALFGLWHLAWPLVLLVSSAEPLVPLPLYAVGIVLVTGMVGAVFGRLVQLTGTLWTAVAAHLLHNGVAVVVHLRGAGGARASVLSSALVLGYVALAYLAWRRYGDEGWVEG